jgi:hypothetical protein
MVRQSGSTRRTAAWRRSALSLAKTCSIGLRSGEYFGRKNNLAPAARMVRRTALPLWLPRLAITTFSNHAVAASLYDNPSARDLVSMLPLDLTIDDYSTNEKIAYLPRKLTEEGSGPFDNERPGDLGYFAPWGNLAFFYAGYRYSSGLIRPGRTDGDFAPLPKRGKLDLHIELLP